MCVCVCVCVRGHCCVCLDVGTCVSVIQCVSRCGHLINGILMLAGGVLLREGT